MKAMALNSKLRSPEQGFFGNSPNLRQYTNFDRKDTYGGSQMDDVRINPVPSLFQISFSTSPKFVPRQSESYYK